LERFTRAQYKFIAKTKEPLNNKIYFLNVKIHLTILGDEMDTIAMILEQRLAKGAHLKSVIKTSHVKTSPLVDFNFSFITLEWQSVLKA